MRPDPADGHGEEVTLEHVSTVMHRIRSLEASFRPAAAGNFRAHLSAHAAEPVPVGDPAPSIRALRAGAPAAAAAPARPPTADSTTTGARLMWPVRASLTSDFGPRLHPIHREWRNHAGIDLGAAAGTPVQAAAEGVVSFAGWRGGYGNVVIIDHADGLQTFYAHQQDLDVSAGDHVAAGTVLGRVGSTGNSTGPHLHFEVRRDGESVDPVPYLEGSP